MWFISLIGIRGLIAGGVMLAAGLALAWQIQGIRLKDAKADITRLHNEIAACQDANKTSEQAIVGLKAEIQGSKNLCSRRMSVRDKTTQRLREIDNTKETRTNEDPINSSGDALLDELNGMFKPSSGSKD